MIIKNGKKVIGVSRGTTPIIKIYKGTQVIWTLSKIEPITNIPVIDQDDIYDKATVKGIMMAINAGLNLSYDGHEAKDSMILEDEDIIIISYEVLEEFGTANQGIWTELVDYQLVIEISTGRWYEMMNFG